MKGVYLLFAIFLLLGCQGGEETELVNEPVVNPTDVPTEVAIEPTPVETTQADANVEFVRIVATGENTYTFHVTVAHPDTGWDDYADGWDVVLPDGTVLKRADTDQFTRLLTHPHKTEQPFTRSQLGVVISAEITTVTVRAHDLVDGFGGNEILVDLLQTEGEGFKIER